MNKANAVWISCVDCGRTDRALAVMVRRVIADRQSCPSCGSTKPAILHPTTSGAHVVQPEWQRDPFLLQEGTFFTSYVTAETSRSLPWTRRVANRLRASLLPYTG